jgi:hypothetical protein
MSFWKILPSWGGWVGIILTVVVLASVGGWSILLLQSPVNMASFGFGLAILITIVIVGVLAYWTYGYFSLYYILDRDALRIYWAGYETIVPLSEIHDVQAASAVAGHVSLPLLHWPGYQIGRGHIEGLGRVYFFSTQPRENQLLIVASGRAYAISPEDPEGLHQALKLRQSLGAMHPIAPAVVGGRVLGLSFWTDYLAQGLWGVALLLNVALFGYLCAIYPALPPILPFHFDAAGQIDRLGPAMNLFAIPAIGALGLLVNGVVGIAIHSGQRLGTVILWAGTVLIQSYLWMAALAVVMGQGLV